ncbi:MAG TPA: ABC transporter ATP-binding protein, partial [Patescibacteria group bacterium]|nr:ABC transporter ATP-binding protein [Patescibacteria group bacterium]
MNTPTKNVITKEFWQKLWFILKPFQKRMLWLFTMISVFELLKLINPYFMKLIIDYITSGDHLEFIHLLSFVFLMLATDIFVTLVHYFKDKKIFAFLILIEYSLPIDLQKKLVSLSLGYHERENTGNKIMKVQRGVDRLSELMSNASWEFFPTITQIIFTFLSMLYFSWQVSLVFIVFIPIFIIITLKMNKVTNPLRTHRHEEYENAAGILGQSIINIYTVQSFVQEKNETKKYQNIRDNIASLEGIEWPIVLNYNLLRSIIVDLGRISVILLSAYFAWQGTITVGSLVFFITLSETAYHALFRLSRTYDRLIENSTGVERITGLLSEKSSIINKPKITTAHIKGQIEFQDVSFAYHKDSHFQALDKVNFKIKPGETIA